MQAVLGHLETRVPDGPGPFADSPGSAANGSGSFQTAQVANDVLHGLGNQMAQLHKWSSSVDYLITLTVYKQSKIVRIQP